MSDQPISPTVVSVATPATTTPTSPKLRAPKPAQVNWEGFTADTAFFYVPELKVCDERCAQQFTAFHVSLMHPTFFKDNKAAKTSKVGKRLDVTAFFPATTPIKDAFSMQNLQTDKIESGWKVFTQALGDKVMKALPKDTMVVGFWSQRLNSKGVERRVFWGTIAQMEARVKASAAILKLANDAGADVAHYESMVYAPATTGDKTKPAAAAKPDASALILG